jgi:3-oxoacyl-[acyl-carrier-protein] synthase III
MNASASARFYGIAYELGELCSVHEILEEGISQESFDALLEKGLQTYSRFDTPLPEAIKRCAAGTLAEAGVEPGEVDAVIVVTECFAGLIEGREPDGDPDFRAARNVVFDSLAGIGITSAVYFCTTFGGSSNFLQAAMIAKPLVEGGNFRNMLMVCADRIPHGETRLMEAAVALTGDGVATCLVTARQPARALPSFGIEYVGISPYMGTGHQTDWTRLILEMYRSTKGAAADCYDALGLQPEHFEKLVLSNYNELTTKVFTRLLGFAPDRTFSQNATRTGHVPACDPLINLKDMSSQLALPPEARLLVYANGPISCGVASLVSHGAAA